MRLPLPGLGFPDIWLVHPQQSARSCRHEEERFCRGLDLWGLIGSTLTFSLTHAIETRPSVTHGLKCFHGLSSDWVEGMDDASAAGN